MAKLLKRTLKPGGVVVVVVDHATNADGNPTAITDALHRIHPAVVKNVFVKAGFVFDGESMVLRNSADDPPNRCSTPPDATTPTASFSVSANPHKGR